jgi:diguanylate cyclase (GGDEF)-like protein
MQASASLYGLLGGNTAQLVLTRQIEPLAAAATVFFFLNSAFVAIAVALTTRQRFFALWFDCFLSTWPSYVLGVGFAAAACFAVQQRSYGLMVVLGSALALIHWNSRSILGRLNDGVTDPLTGLPNQRFVMEHVERELLWARRARKNVAVVVLDLDRFKEINDRAGHAVGDAALRCVAESLKQTVRVSDICARYGGDEFVIVMPDCSASAALRTIQDAQLAVATIGSGIASSVGALTISAGAAEFPTDGDHFNALFAIADARMYDEKARRHFPQIRQRTASLASC